MQQRNQSLDALRGLAILAMVLSSSIAFGILPAWMYHAQEPPPTHEFIPTLPGISWVDLVFPFFLFSMGAAIPLSLHKKAKQGNGFRTVLFVAVRRYILLVYFALFTLHMRPGNLSASPSAADYLLAIGAFALLFLQLYEPVDGRFKKFFTVLKVLAFATAAVLLYCLPFKDGKGLSLYQSDIIILLLANMAFFGSLIWWFTRNHPLYRAAVLPLIMAILLGSSQSGSWNETVFHWSPLPWIYQFAYLKYLFIIIPGTWAGDWLLQDKVAVSSENSQQVTPVTTIGMIAFLLVVTNVVLLFSRHTVINLLLTGAGCALLFYLLKKVSPRIFLQRFFAAGAYLLLLGLFFEAFEGGIKKDPSTYSYYLVTSGLAFLMLIALYAFQHIRMGNAVIKYLSLNGRNPMVAYVTGNLVLLPLLYLTGGIKLFQQMESCVWTGVLRGFLFTGIVSAVTILFTKRGWFWKT
jgi:predicted acyltransferase